MLMRWIGDDKTDLRISLMDDSQNVIFGQVVKDNSGWWNGFLYIDSTVFLGSFKTVEEAKQAVDSAATEPHKSMRVWIHKGAEWKLFVGKLLTAFVIFEDDGMWNVYDVANGDNPNSIKASVSDWMKAVKRAEEL